MAETVSFQAEMRQLLRERSLDVARRIVCSDGWSAVKISSIAKEVGINRPALYKEFGSKQAFGEALVAREADVFLAGVVDGLRAHADDAVAGMVQAAEFALQFGSDNALLKAILIEREGQDGGLLPFLVADPETVLARAVSVIDAVVREQYSAEVVGDSVREDSVEVLVRLTLSHLYQPRGSIEDAVGQIRRVITSLLYAQPDPGQSVR
ncbi:TetR family transcriptional regulator [Nocardia sp. FBN12]|uniref:TetR family transcriptional regulator n=1 Tax=Nocardia sp. FBN12 TaxID=3419766 RepID=UPI003CFC2E04